MILSCCFVIFRSIFRVITIRIRRHWLWTLSQRELQAYFKKISVKVKLKGSSLKLGKALRNGKPQAAAFCISCNITADKTFRQFFCRNV